MILVARRKAIFVALVAVALLVAVAVEPAVAGPGGIIKQAARTTWGKVVMALLAILFLPLIIWYSVKRQWCREAQRVLLATRERRP